MILSALPGIVIPAIAMVVIVGAMSVIFISVAAYFSKSIKDGGDDKDVTAALRKKYDKYLLTHPDFSGYEKFLGLKSKRQRVLGVISNIFYITVIVLSVCLGAAAVFFRSRDGQFFIGDTAYMNVITDSMERKNPKNTYYKYLLEHPELENDMGQIPQNTLVSIKKTDSYELYDIVAYVYRGTTYIHRIVEIDENGLITTMGDSNPASLYFERKMPAERLIGVYGGFKSEFLGYTLTFCKSDIGIVTLVGLVIFLFVADIARSQISNATKARTLIIARELDSPEATEKKENCTELSDETK